jgi:hypothetical protein
VKTEPKYQVIIGVIAIDATQMPMGTEVNAESFLA